MVTKTVVVAIIQTTFFFTGEKESHIMEDEKAPPSGPLPWGSSLPAFYFAWLA